MSDGDLRELERRGRAGDVEARRAYRAAKERLAQGPWGFCDVRALVGLGQRLSLEWRVHCNWPWALRGPAVVVVDGVRYELGHCWTHVLCAKDVALERQPPQPVRVQVIWTPGVDPEDSRERLWPT